MNGISSPLEGLQRAEAQIADSAKRLSRLPSAFTALLEGASVVGGEPIDVVDLSAESVALLQVRNVADANIAALQAFDQIQQHLLHLFGQ